MTHHRICAIHQPNLFPRASTVAKLLAADVWVVLDNVQFNARDYQHRMRLAPVADPTQAVWLTLPAHRPRGRASLIGEVRLAEPVSSARRLMQLPKQYYGSRLYWPEVAKLLEAVVPLVVPSGHLTDVAEASTRVILRALGWQGQIVRSSTFNVHPERSQRLADLTAATGSSEYLCGPGGARYLDEKPFAELGLGVRYVSVPSSLAPDQNRLSVLGQIATEGLNSCRPMRDNR